MHGQGQLTLKDGQTYIGKWLNGESQECEMEIREKEKHWKNQYEEDV